MIEIVKTAVIEEGFFITDEDGDGAWEKLHVTFDRYRPEGLQIEMTTPRSSDFMVGMSFEDFQQLYEFILAERARQGVVDAPGAVSG